MSIYRISTSLKLRGAVVMNRYYFFIALQLLVQIETTSDAQALTTN